MEDKKKKTDVQIRKEWEKEWWKDFYPRCKECTNECKQSWKILDLLCKNFRQS